MKKILLMLAVIFSMMLSTASSSSAKPRIPAEVKNYIQTNYPNAKGIHWQRHEGVYIAQFISDKVETVVYLSEKGEFMNKLTEVIAYNELPDDIRARVDPKKVLSGEKLEGSEGEIFYIFSVTRPKGKIEEIVFDGSGKEIKDEFAGEETEEIIETTKETAPVEKVE